MQHLLQPIYTKARVTVNLIVEVRLSPVNSAVPILTHHDNGCSVGSLETQDYIHEHEGVVVPSTGPESVDHYPEND
jgi:hypothetical protein